MRGPHHDDDDRSIGAGPPLLRRVAYRLHLRRLPPEHRDWVQADLQRPGARGRFAGTAAVALALWWAFYVLVVDLPLRTFVPLALFVAAMLWLVTRPPAWRNVEASVLRRHGIVTVAQIAGAREGAGYWVDGQWWCDAHGHRFCAECAPRAER